MTTLTQRITDRLAEYDEDIATTLRQIHNVMNSLDHTHSKYNAFEGLKAWKLLSGLFWELKLLRGLRQEFLNDVKTGKWR